jgi:hypothetical protein
MNTRRNIGALAIFAMLLCSGMTCRQLDPAGVYQGDSALYESELAINTSYDIVHTFVDWELKNRAALAKYPEIGKSAIRLRRDYKGWHESAIALHDVYEANKTDENRTKLMNAVGLLRKALEEATKHMTQAAQPST